MKFIISNEHLILISEKIEQIKAADLLISFLNSDISKEKPLIPFIDHIPNNSSKKASINDIIKKLILGYINNQIDNNQNEKENKDIYYDKIKKLQYTSKIIADEIIDVQLSNDDNEKTVHYTSEKYDDYNDEAGVSAKISIKLFIEYSFGGFTEYYEIETIDELINLCLSMISRNNIALRKCSNCFDYFYPKNRTDEVYCDKVLPNKKTCKEVGFKNRVKQDKFLKEYVKIYNSENAKLNRDIKNPKNEKQIELIKSNYKIRWEENQKLRKKYTEGQMSGEELISKLKRR